MKEVRIMDEGAINRALTRISYEIIEQQKDVSDLVVIGIKTRGITLAKRIASKISALEKINVPVGEVDITLYRDDRHNSKNEESPVLNGTNIPFGIKAKQIVLVDDVLFTGRTVRAALDAIMDIDRPKKISLAILIDRGHRELPIRPDFIGKNVPTSLDEVIHVRLTEDDNKEEVIIEK